MAKSRTSVNIGLLEQCQSRRISGIPLLVVILINELVVKIIIVNTHKTIRAGQVHVFHIIYNQPYDISTF